ncbi:MAG: hypothetical protein SFV23_14875 [Planctomycetaceae bacterium]|nr:hypothetical protein [Planctomycetaceae bacterium]
MNDAKGMTCDALEARPLPRSPGLSTGLPDAWLPPIVPRRTIRRTRGLAAASLLVLLGLPISAGACAIPVFRYALERWQSDLFEVDVFHRGPMSAADRAAVSSLEDLSLVNGGPLNLEVVACDVAGVLDDDLQLLWRGLDDPALPYFVVRAPGGRGGSPIVWKGGLADVPSSWGETPVERELQRRILAGDSIVWVLLAGEDAAVAERLAATITDALPTLVESIPLPPGIGLPGSQLMSAIPLEIRFSVLTVALEDAANTWLRRCAIAHAREPVADGETLLLPIFGRGRALAVLKPSEADFEALAELTRFLCGACSCQAKDLNPGFDLLLAVDWDRQLFDPQSQQIHVSARTAASREPELVPIPPGNSTASTTEAIGSQLLPMSEEAASSGAKTTKQDQPLLWGGVIVVLAVYLWRRGRRRVH